MEVAASLAESALSLAIVDMVDVPFKPVLGETIGQALQTVC